MHRRVRFIFLAIALLTWGACVPLQKRASQRHVQLEADKLGAIQLELPYPLAWNAGYRWLRSRGPVVLADYEGGRCQSDWRYAYEDRGARRTESRVREELRLQGRGPIRAELYEVKEIRTTELGQPPGSWVPSTERSPAEADLKVALIADELAWRSRVPINATPAQATAAVGDVLRAKYGTFAPASTGASTDWHQEKVSLSEDEQLLYRHRVTATVKGMGELVSLEVLVERQRSHAGGEEVGEWEAAPAPTIQLELVRLMQAKLPTPADLPVEAPLVDTTAETSPPELPILRDPLVGRYVLVVESVYVMPTKASGRTWDVTGGFLVKLGVGAAMAVSGAGLVAVGSATKAVDSFSDEIPGPQAPDLQGELQINGQHYLMPLVQDTFGAAWNAEIPLRLNGREQNVANWTIQDIDLENHDLVGSGSVTLRELIDAGQAVEQAGGQVRVIRFRLTRVGD